MECEGWLRGKDGANAAGRIRIGPEGFTFEPNPGAGAERISVSVGGLEKAPIPSKKKPTLQVTTSAAPKEPFVLDFGPVGNEAQAVERRDSVRESLITFLQNRGPAEPAVVGKAAVYRGPTIWAREWQDSTPTIRSDGIQEWSRRLLVESNNVMTDDEFLILTLKCQPASFFGKGEGTRLEENPMHSRIPGPVKLRTTSEGDDIEIDYAQIDSLCLEHPSLKATEKEHLKRGMTIEQFYTAFYDFWRNGEAMASNPIQYMQYLSQCEIQYIIQ